MTRHPHGRVLLIALVLPVALAAVALGIVIAWLPQLPATVAVHWGLGGADGFGDPVALAILLAVVGFGIPLMFGGLLAFTTHTIFGFGQKVIAVISLGATVLICIIMLAAVGSQRGLKNASDAPDILPWVLVSFGAGILVGAIAWFVLPRWTRSADVWRAAAPLPLAADERAVWLGIARFPAAIMGAILLPLLLVTVVAAWAGAHDGGPVWLVILVPVLLFLLAIGSTAWRVRVDATSLRVRSVLGFPSWTIPFDDISEAGTTTVQAFGEFGGWGVRWAGRGRLGVITRSGPALDVRRRAGGSFVVTVDDADTAAALVTARIKP